MPKSPARVATSLAVAMESLALPPEEEQPPEVPAEAGASRVPVFRPMVEEQPMARAAVSRAPEQEQPPRSRER